MKKLYIVLLVSTFTNIAMAQVAIGKETVDGSGILDFQAETQKGIILPWVLDYSLVAEGSLVYNAIDKKVQFRNGVSWQDLSVKEGAVDLSEIDLLDDLGEGVIIGDKLDAPTGVLVLNRPGTALILPKNTTPWDNILNPEAGTITYDPNTDLICIFNGSEWTFWGL